MEDQKLDNMLNLSLSVSEAERNKSLELEVGYQPIFREWELILKYTGSLDCVKKLGGEVVELLNEFAIVTVREDKISDLTDCISVEFVEKPKRLFFALEEGKRVSCINGIQRPPLELTGKGVLLGIVDSGIDFRNRSFRKEDGTTRIKAYWDQDGEGNAPAGYRIGREYTEEEINRDLNGEEIVASRDVSGHGTAVAGIAAGIATESELLIVKLGTPRKDGFPRTTELMQGIDYIVRKAIEYQMPVSINISFGNTYGAHDGSGLLERFIEDISNNWKSVICIGTGNEGNSAGHTGGTLNEREETRIELGVQENSTSINVQIWKAYFDEVDISLISPSGVLVGPVQERLGTQQFVIGNTIVLLYYGEPSPFSIDQEIYFEFLPKETYIDGGVWTFVLTPRKIVNGAFSMWLPSENVLNEGTGFLRPKAERTLTIPATAYGTIGVGAYDPATMTYADFSGRGPAGPGRRAKPDLVAPGVDVLVPNPGGTFSRVSGTSFAAPFVTGGAALLMEWGIVRGNDPFLYGEKVRAYFQRGARPFSGVETYPDEAVGYGALCVENSLPL